MHRGLFAAMLNSRLSGSHTFRTAAMSSEEQDVLRFLAELPELVEREQELFETSPFAGRLMHQYVNYAIADRFPDIDWRKAIRGLHQQGYIEDPARFRTARIVVNQKVTDVVTPRGRQAIQQ